MGNLLKELECNDENTVYVINEQGTERGIVIGESEEYCEVESCRGTVLLVKWQDGEVTECCTHGMDALSENVWRII